MRDFASGSEWRRWDLHIHTPGTLKNDCFAGENLEKKWDNYYSAIKDYVGDGEDPQRAICVIGITDYASIENYKKIINDNKLPDCIQLVLPNVEMRLTLTTSESPVNIHFIFNPEIVDMLDDWFFSKLEFIYGDPFVATRTGLIALGKRLREDRVNDDEAYKIGVDSFLVSLSNLQKIFKENETLRKQTIIAVSNSSTDGVSGYGRKAGQTVPLRKSIYKLADAIFSGNPNDAKYFLGEGVDNAEKIISEYGGLMPCIHGSDAHCLEKIFEPDRQRYCWIKADPTFNGLRQILYEPQQRVKIQPLSPDESSQYQTIKKIEILDERFTPQPLYFNSALNCIIGGRSTGKSLLLHNIARAVLGMEDKKIKDTPLGRQVDMQVYWGDGAISDVNSINDEHRVVYIPQSYLNQLVDVAEEKTEIDDLIQSVLHQNMIIRASYSALQSWERSYREEVDKNIYDLIRYYENAQDLILEIADIGTEVGIQQELTKQKEARDKIVDTLKLSSEDILKYNKAISDIKRYKNILVELQQDEELLLKLDSLVIKGRYNDGFSQITKEKLDVAANEIIAIADEAWRLKRDELIKEIQVQRESITKELELQSGVEEKLHDQIASSETLQLLNKSIQEEEEKLKTIESRKSKLEKEQNQYSTLLQWLSNVPIQFYRKLNEYASEINAIDSETNSLIFGVEVPFRKEAFTDRMYEILNQKSLKAGKIDLDGFTADESINEFFYRLIDNIMSSTLALKKNYSKEDALRAVLSNWYNMTYTVKLENDSLSQMSPGKKALVLLQLLISLQASDCPILIDQPEDDLDNRSIFDDLVDFIKKRKINRQIITVTHNANIVLGCDSEEIIVANQNGENSPNDTYQFEYRSGSIENDYPVGGRGILSKVGIQQHICEILEGGVKAFELREKKYRINGTI